MGERQARGVILRQFVLEKRVGLAAKRQNPVAPAGQGLFRGNYDFGPNKTLSQPGTAAISRERSINQ